MNANQWGNKYKLVVWLSLLLFFTGFIFFFVSYVGNDWYVVPPSRHAYPPEALSIPVKLGLFWMCVYGHCKYDLRVDYTVVGYLPYQGVQNAYQNYRTVCMVIITIAACVCLLALGLNLTFMARYTFSRFIGVIAGAAEILAAIIALVGIGIFGSMFRGPTETMPFGWSFWLMVASVIIFLLDGVLTILLGLAVMTNLRNFSTKDSSQLKPLASGN